MARRNNNKTLASRPKPAGTIRIIMPSSSTQSAKADTPATPKAPEIVTEEDVNKLSIADLTLDTPLRPLRPRRRVPATPFHFLALPSELRIKIYTYFFSDMDPILDLGPDNYKRVHSRLRLMRVCKQIHEEATYYFYSTRTFRIFPTYPGRHFKSKKPLLSRLKPLQRQAITSLELRLGPGWNAPPRGWVVNPALGLQECAEVERLKVFVEFDPSHHAFRDFRRYDGFYEGFSRKLLLDVLDALPGVSVVEFDGWSGVKKSGEMMKNLLEVVAQSDRLVEWGPQRGWTDSDDNDDEDEIPGVEFAGGVPINVMAVA